MKCYRCKKEKTEAEFNKESRQKNGLSICCKECNKLACKEYYRKNKEEHIKICGRNKRKYYKSLKQRLTHLKSVVGCQIEGCDETEACCLDFHHIYADEKEFLVSRMLGNVCSWPKLAAEIIKCVLVCANCHRKIHSGLIEGPKENLKEIIVELYGPLGFGRVKNTSKKITKNCDYCGKQFETYNKKFCSMKCSHMASRKVKRPDEQQLLQEIESSSWKAIGRKYGVCDNTIRRWARGYDLI